MLLELRDHARIHDLIAEALLPPDQQRAVDIFAAPARLRIRPVDGIASPKALLVVPPAFGKASQAQTKISPVPDHFSVLGLERERLLIAQQGLFVAAENL